MEEVIFTMVFITSVSWVTGEHVFVSEKKNWTEAQSYCRDHYTDLSPINSERDTERLRGALAGHTFVGWIGLYREPTNTTGWRWSGGGYATYQNWSIGQPNNHRGIEYCARTEEGLWWDDKLFSLRNFFCLNLIMVEEKKTWEEALEHCREHHSELTSLVSETELLLAQREIKEAQSTDHVWIGLRYLRDGWLWVDGEPVEYKAWPPRGDQDHRCPNSTQFCGVLTKEGLWESWDCRDKLNFICY